MKIETNRVEIDTDGYRKQMEEIEPWRIIQEIIANSFDEDSVSEINAYITQENGLACVRVTDNGDGFRDIRDIYTMYKHSYKRKLKNKIGKFNLGEKQFFILCETGYIKTANTMVEFKANQRIESNIEYPKNTEVYGTFKWNATQIKETLRMLHRLIVPEGKKLYINDTPVRALTKIASFETSLFTEVEDDKQIMRRIKSIATVDLYSRYESERPHLFGLGVPIQPLSSSIPWNINIRNQKIPLSSDRDKVTEAWLEDLYAGLVNNPDLIDAEHAGSTWVQIGLKKATKENASKILSKIWGNKPLFFKSNNHHSNEQAIESGGQLVPANMFDRETRNQLASYDLIQYATDVFKTDIVTGSHVEPSEEMIFFSNVIKKLALECGYIIQIEFVYSKDATTLAQAHNNTITYNIAHLGKDYFKTFTVENLGLTIHELAHMGKTEEGESHLTMDYVHELQRIAGILGLKGIDYYQRQIIRNELQ